jgi:16S rRNA (adenine(1408)-N(1))-methyltransferase
VVVDLGTGEGGAVLRRARLEPQTLAIGVDTDAAAMRDASHRAAAKPARGGLPNALFLAGPLAEMPPPLRGAASELRVTLPWGSLLRAARAPEPAFMRACLELLQPGGSLRLLVSVTDRDLAAGAQVLEGEGTGPLATAYASAGFTPVECRPATVADVEETGSTWAKRLGIPLGREAWLLVARRPAMQPGTTRATGGGTLRHAPRV